MTRQLVKELAERTWQQVRIVSQDTLASIDSVVNDLAKMPGSRMLLLVSSGFLAGTLEREQDQMINRALRAGVVINALDAKGLYAEAPVRPFEQPQEEPELPATTFQFEVRSSLDRQVKVEEPVQEFPVTLTVQSRKLAGGSAVFTARIHVDVKTLRFLQRDGRRMQKLTFVTALVDAHGSLVAAKEGAMDLALTDASCTRFSAIGINAVGSLEAPPGGYRLRAVVQDGVEGKTSSLAQAVEVR